MTPIALCVLGVIALDARDTAPLETLRREVAGKGFIMSTAATENGSKDLFISRPDGSDRRNVTGTADFDEAAGRWSPDGTRMLYRRMKRGTVVSHDHYGEQGELVLADGDGANPKVFGGPGEYPWASWDNTGKHLACLGRGAITVVDVETKRSLATFPAKGIYQQLFWSPDGKWFCGTASVSGTDWCIVRMDAATGYVNVAARFRCCTPDWFPDSARIVHSCRPPNQPGYGWTQLWETSGDGKDRRMLFGEDGRHIYCGCLSPDGRYVLFVGSAEDGGGAEKQGAPMWLMRMADTPAIAGESRNLHTAHPDAKEALRLPLGTAWDPHWTYADVRKKP